MNKDLPSVIIGILLFLLVIFALIRGLMYIDDMNTKYHIQQRKQLIECYEKTQDKEWCVKSME